ncbi:hypothetical protein PACTADRAFT_39631 [Pachysolen tannophilus NRRL Y-2460]|uniref:Serine/threonine-protein phosphatase 2A activator n=1 Tax=Pachysolen tannophilus NRRL Y-2460 TaxID=669874 RepID=A0A1E4TY53_PACTA|nr:hypothetical protein PACTADRAFT_39631 [Pachysolen tannophilus NRRL Y-2460]
MLADTVFIEPVRRIVTDEDLKIWKDSDTHKEVVCFVETLSKSVRGKKISDIDIIVSENCNCILNILQDIEIIFKKHPVVSDREASRFGKPEFRDFYDDLHENISHILGQRILALSQYSNENDPRIELAVYLNESFGNRTRIDYGSGHELNFICFLLCLRNLGILNLEKDSQALVLKIFYNYIKLMRSLQKEYWLEPAGSHGVWGLDDYHFLPFLFGASQLSTHEFLKPKSIHNKEVVEMFAPDYFYFECINFINEVKTESLRWHSPMLDDISGVKTWSKVEEGMFKMFQGEVLNKLPIVQHFFFGNIIKCPQGISEARTNDDESLPVHSHFGDSCGIKVPAAFGAAEFNKRAKPLPFD